MVRKSIYLKLRKNLRKDKMMEETLDKIENIIPGFKREYDYFLDCDFERDTFRLGDGIEYTTFYETTLGNYHIIFNAFFDINRDFIVEIIEIKHEDVTKDCYGLVEVLNFIQK